MFEYVDTDGVTLPENEITTRALQNGLTINEYIKKNNLTLRPKQKTVPKQKEVFPKAQEIDVLGVEKMKKMPVSKSVVQKPEIEFDAKKFAKEKTLDSVKGFYTKGEKNIKTSGIKVKEEEQKTVSNVFDTFSTFNYKYLSPEEKQSIDDSAVSLLSKGYEQGEDYKLSTSDIELKSMELLSKANNKKKSVEDETYAERGLSGLAKGLNYVGEMFASVPETTYSFFALPQNAIAWATGNKDLEASPEKFKTQTGTSNPVMDHFINEQKRIGKENDIYDNANYDSTSISQNMADGNWTDAFKLIGSGIAESAPVSIGMMLGGAEVGIAKTAIGATTLFAGPNIRQQKEEHPEDSEMSQVLSGFGMAAAESVFSSIGEGSIGKVYKDIIKKEGIDQGASIMKNGLVLAYQTALKKFGMPVAMAGEGIEEVATTITQNLIDNKKPFDNVLDSFIQGVAGGGLYGSPITIAKGISGFKDGVALYRVNSELKSDVSNSMLEAFNPNTPVSQAQINITKIKGAPKVLSNQIQDAINKGDMTEDEGNQIKKDFATTYGISKKLEPLNLLESKLPEAVQLSKEKNDLLRIVKHVGDKELTTPQLERIAEINIQLTGIARESVEATAAKRTGDKDKLTNEEAIEANISDDVNKARVAVEKLGLSNETEIPELKTANDVRTYLENNTKLSPEDINKYEDSNGLFVTLNNGKQALIVNQEEAAMGFNITTGQHEFMHKLVNKAIGQNPEMQAKVGESLYRHIEDYLGTEAFNRSEFKHRYNGYKLEFEQQNTKAKSILGTNASNLKEGKVSQEDHDAIVEKTNASLAKAKGNMLEETLPLLSESLSKGDIKYNETFFIKLGDLLRQVLQNIGIKNVNFGNGKDVFDFVRDYNKSFEKGEFTKAFKKLGTEGKISETKEVKESKSLELKKELEDLNEKYDEGYGDMDEAEYLPKKQNLEAKIKSAIKKESEAKTTEPTKSKEVTEEDEVKEIIKNERGTLSSDKVQQIYDKKGKEGAAEIISLFKPITKKIVDKRRDAPGFDRELLTDEIETGTGGILDLITKYKPESGIPLAAWINKYLPMRAIAASKRVLGTEFMKDAAEEVGLKATETADQNMTVNALEKPKYKNVLESNVFEPDVLKTINNKILTVVRTLKSKINEPVSLNKTVTPLIAEIRDEIGKQIDIDVKTAMGGKKDNQLKNWLLKNKKYVLENMTTTWLMGKDGQGGMPIAVQKRVDGRWVSFPEWVGKSIDRESVSTDQAGRTSGHELARRLPNVANNISNEEFLNQVIGPDGNPLRGRKESLAKAISEESAFDIITDDLNNEGLIYEAFTANQQRLGVELVNDVAIEVSRQVERGNVKLSMPTKDFNAISSKLFHTADEYGIESLEVENILNSIPEEDRYKIKQHVFEDHIDLVAKMQKIKAGIRGVAYESIILKELKALKIKGVKVLTKEVKGYDSTGDGDIHLQLGKDLLNIEVKLNALAQMGSFTINANFDNNTFSPTKELNISNELIDLLKSKLDKFEEYKKEAEKLGVKTDSWPYKVTKEQHSILKTKGFQKSLTVSIATDQKIIEQLYNGKNVHYINIGKHGLFALGKDKLNLGVPLLSSDVKLTARIVRGGDYNRIRVFPTLVNFKQKSKYNVDNATSNNALFSEYKRNTEIKQNIENSEIASNSFDAEKVRESKTLSPEFNKIIEETSGMEHYKEFSDIVARRRGATKNKFDFYVPPSAADFELLLYNFVGKGKQGEEHLKFFNDALLKPYTNGNDLMDAARQSIKREYKALTNAFPEVRKKIETLTPDKDFTYDQAIRVAMWTEAGIDIPGLSERDATKLTQLVADDPELNAFKNGLIVMGRQGPGWIEPTKHWDADTIIADLHNITEGDGRKKFLGEFIANVEQIFGKWDKGSLVGPNMNKIEAVYGTNVREAIEDVVYRMTSGKNRSSGKDKETSAWSNWINGSTGTIMFLNTRSAVLQLIGAVNFLNLRDNNPVSAAARFADQPQYWKDFAHIWNSDKMKERRGGLKDDVAAAEIANSAAGSKNKAVAVTSYLLKIGYTPTQLADSFAIASGGASFYRNRIKSYLKEGMSDAEAEKAAWNDFTKVSDETQQSGDPRDISKQQASGAGRLLLTFQNTAMQQSRIVKKSFLDLKNGRGDAKTHMAKIVYYLAIQNIMFSALQNGLFAVGFGSDDEEDEEKAKAKAKDKKRKIIDAADGVLDTILRGTGFYGGVAATLKNVALKYLDEKDKKFKADYAKVVLEAANISPPIGSKLRKIYSGLQSTKYDKDLIKERGWSIMQDGRVHLGPMYSITGKLVEAGTNIPMDRLVSKIENVSQALNSQNEAWQRVMVGLGWNPFTIGIENKADVEIKAKAKEVRKTESSVATVEKNKAERIKLRERLRGMTLEEKKVYKDSLKTEKRAQAKKRKMIWDIAEKNKNK
jgi:hypothetical protein